MPKLFTRMFMGSKDAKHRVSLPAAFRDVVEERCGARTLVVLDKHPVWPCLRGYDPLQAESLFSSVTDKFGDAMSTEQELMAAELLSSQTHCALDSGGRFVLDECLRRELGLDGEVLFMGLGHHFHVWKPELAIEMFDPKGMVKAFVESYRMQKGGAA